MDTKEKLSEYVNLRMYFAKYVYKYMADKLNVSRNDIYHWTLGDTWLVVEYYSEESGNDEEMDLLTTDFIKYIENL